ncbi:MAG: phosphodiester glycosidase family protein [Burkholderiales bacterium]|nr:phosphodiester glycosidase family protein [Anaerolineae bacterium]
MLRILTLASPALLLALMALACVTPIISAPSGATSAPSAPPVSDGWETLMPGLERRSYQPANALSQLLVLRIDPTLFTFRAHYQPGSPLGIRGWRDALPGSVAFVNANFFDTQGQILGLLVADGLAYGLSYTDRGGTFLVQNGAPRLRSNLVEPYYSGEPIEQAVQAFPMLVQDRQQAYANSRDRDISRRTIVAQDGSGRILLMVTPLGGLNLVDISAYLPTTDMDIVTAFNLDGGGSTMMSLAPINNIAGQMSLGSFDPVPAVLAVYPR